MALVYDDSTFIHLSCPGSTYSTYSTLFSVEHKPPKYVPLGFHFQVITIRPEQEYIPLALFKPVAPQQQSGDMLPATLFPRCYGTG